MTAPRGRETQGPWTATREGEDFEILDAKRDLVATVPPCWSFVEITPARRRRQEERARLLALSPELLAFAERVEFARESDLPSLRVLAASLLARVRGEVPNV